MLQAGKKTDHVGKGRCYLHGGATPVVHGKNSKVVRETILERVSAMEQDPKLLSLDRQLAALHIVFDLQLKRFASEAEGFEEIIEMIQNIAETGQDVTEIPETMVPKLDLETIDTMMKLAKTIYEMRFSKRFSMPITQVQQILMSLMDVFAKICLEYNIPNEARMKFANEIRNLRAVGTQDDPQLAYAGGGSQGYVGSLREVQ